MGTIEHAFNSGEQSANEGLFSNLVTLSRVDGAIDEEEAVMLQRVAQRLSLTEEQIKQIMNHPEEYPMIPPSNKEARFERMIQFIMMTFADGVIHPSETKLVHRFGLAIGFTDGDVNKYTEAISEKIQAGADRDEILSSLM